MASYERTGNPEIPKWWLDEAIPMLERRDVRHVDVAEAASRHARRSSPWGRDAISKFVKGSGRTIELTNGISAALQIPQPFYTAPTKAAASAMALIVRREMANSDEVATKLSVFDGVADRELHSIAVAPQPTAAVVSSDHGEQGRRGGRHRRPGRSRA